MLGAGMRLLVTGATGLAGRNFCEHPALAHCQLLTPSHGQLDLCCAQAVWDYIQTQRPAIVVHAAGRVGGIAANQSDPYGYLMDNLLMGLNVVRAARAAGVRTLLNLASSCAYPRQAASPLREDAILTGSFEPTNEGYALAKVAVLRACSYITAQYPGYHYKTLVPCNLYGRYDHYDPERSHFLPAVIRKLHEARLRGLSSVEIWGDGQVRREVLYAADLATAMVLCLEHMAELPAVVNAGTGVDYTVDQYYAIAARALGMEVSFTHDRTRPNGMPQKLMDCTLLQGLGFKPAYTLEQGFREAYAYYCSIAAG